MFRPVRTMNPAESPVTLDEIKAHAVVDYGDDDTLLTMLRDAAVERLDGFRGILGRALVTQTWEIGQASWYRQFVLPVPDVSAVTITYLDGSGTTQAVAAGMVQTYAVSGGTLVRLSDDFDCPTLQSDHLAPVTVAFTCGFGGAAEVPAPIKAAISALAAHLNLDREAEELPRGVYALIAPYRWRLL